MRREDRRDAILDVAQECFVAEGYGATSMSTIAARLGGSKGTLYNYFRSKEELFDAFVRRTCARLQTKLEAQPETGDVRTRLVKMATDFLTFLLSPDAIAVYRLTVGEGERFPELSRLFYEAGPRISIGRTAEVLGRLMDQGVLRRADPITTARQFNGLAMAGCYNMRLWGVIDDPAPGEIAELAATAVDTFLRAYAA
jgi:AcrR family transcriptional regulator